MTGLTTMTDEIELLCMVRRNAIQRAVAGEIKRPDHWFDRQRASLAAYQGVLKLLRDLNDREGSK